MAVLIFRNFLVTMVSMKSSKAWGSLVGKVIRLAQSKPYQGETIRVCWKAMNLRWIEIPPGREAIHLETSCLGHFSWLSKWRNVFVTKVLLAVIFSHVNWLTRNSSHMLVWKHNTLCREEFPKSLHIPENMMITVPVLRFQVVLAFS